MESLALALLGNLKIFGEIYLEKLGKKWVNEIEKLEERLWKATQKPDKEKDMKLIVNLIEEVSRVDKKFKRYHAANLAKAK